MSFGSVFLVGLVILVGALLCNGLPTVLNLERPFPIHHPTNLSHLIQRDRDRHRRSLQSSDGVIDYTLGGTWDLLVGLYYTRVELGTPPTDFYVQVDTGSDVSWVGCVPCADCPTTTGIPNISLHLYNPASSSSFSALSCFEEHCPSGVGESTSNCSSDNHLCSYSVVYADKSETFGFYVQDLLNYDRIVGNSRTVKSTAPFVFGCTTVETDFSSSSITDGILGFGHRALSLISQLSAQGLSPKAFSHCLTGDGDGGGVLVLGEIVEKNIVYSPLIPLQPHYNLDLQRISVNGKTLPIDPTVLSSSAERGAIIDSGTTLVYLAMEALVQVNTAVNTSTSARSVPSLYDFPCYRATSTIEEEFPQVSLHFAGSADLVLGPRDYLVYQGSMDGAQLWCMGFRPAVGEDRKTVLGDIVLKNRFFVYDLVGQRIGWTNYNCSAAVNVSIGVKPKHGRGSNASSVSLQLVSWITISTTFVLVLSNRCIPWL